MGLFNDAKNLVNHHREIPNQVRGGYKLPDGTWTNDRRAIRQDMAASRREARQARRR